MVTGENKVRKPISKHTLLLVFLYIDHATLKVSNPWEIGGLIWRVLRIDQSLVQEFQLYLFLAFTNCPCCVSLSNRENQSRQIHLQELCLTCPMPPHRYTSRCSTEKLSILIPKVAFYQKSLELDNAFLIQTLLNSFTASSSVKIISNHLSKAICHRDFDSN